MLSLRILLYEIAPDNNTVTLTEPRFGADSKANAIRFYRSNFTMECLFNLTYIKKNFPQIENIFIQENNQKQILLITSMLPQMHNLFLVKVAIGKD
jgi:hypothetical protein